MAYTTQAAQRRLTKLQYAQLRHGLAHAYLNLEKVSKRGTPSEMSREIKRIAEHLRKLDTVILENHEVVSNPRRKRRYSRRRR